MQMFSFSLHVKEDLTKEWSDKIFKSIPDTTCGMCCGQSYISFDREGTFEDSIINEAIRQVKDIGLTLQEVVKDNED